MKTWLGVLRLFAGFVYLVTTCACAGNRSDPSTAPRPPRHVPTLSSVFGEYASRDAVGVAGWPLAVNRDFDFALAVAMPSVGAGLAVIARRKGNVELAAVLASTLGHAASSGLAMELRDDAVVALLFGAPRARVSVASDARLVPGAVRRFVVVSNERPLTGQSSWDEGGGVRLREALRRGTELLRTLRSDGKFRVGSAARSAEYAGCRLGGAEIVWGTTVGRIGAARVIRSDVGSTLIVCEDPLARSPA